MSPSPVLSGVIAVCFAGGLVDGCRSTKTSKNLASPEQTHEKRATPIDTSARQSFEKQPKIAVLVGIGAYPEGSGLSALKYAVSDVTELASGLEKEGYAVRQLTEAQATRGVILRTLNQIGQMLDLDQGTLVFYFSGHGFTQGGINYLATYGATVDDLQREGLPLTEVEQILKRSRAKRQILWIDACRNDTQSGTRDVSRRTFARLDAAEGLRVFYSTQAGGVSYEDDGLKHGVFTYFLLRGLQGEAAGTDGLVTFQDLTGYVSESVMGYGVKTGRVQRPFEAGESSGDFLLARSSAGRLASLPTTATEPAPPPTSQPSNTRSSVNPQPSIRAQKSWQDQQEYALYTETVKPDATPAAHLQNLEKWRNSYAQSDYGDVRLKIYLNTYQQMNNHRAAFDTAAEILRMDPNDAAAVQEILGYIRTLMPQQAYATLSAQNKADLEIAEKVARALLTNPDASYGAEKKPPRVADDVWANTRSTMVNFAHFTLGYIGVAQNDSAQAETELTKTLALDGTNAQASYLLAGVLLGQQKEHPEKVSGALFEYARSASYDGPNSLPAYNRQQVDAFLNKIYNTWHGSVEGLDELKTKSKAAALPPVGFNIKPMIATGLGR